MAIISSVYREKKGNFLGHNHHSRYHQSINQSILGTKPPASKPNTTIALLETHSTKGERKCVAPARNGRARKTETATDNGRVTTYIIWYGVVNSAYLIWGDVLRKKQCIVLYHRFNYNQLYPIRVEERERERRREERGRTEWRQCSNEPPTRGTWQEEEEVMMYEYSRRKKR